jgi:hypothetical protein
MRALEREIRQLEDRLSFNELRYVFYLFFLRVNFRVFIHSGASTVALNIKQRLTTKKLQYNKLKRIESDLQSKREQIRIKKNDLF